MKLLDQVRRACRTKHLSLRTEQAYVRWTRRYVRYHGLRHPRQLGEADVQAFLSYLAAERGVAASTIVRSAILNQPQSTEKLVVHVSNYLMLWQT